MTLLDDYEAKHKLQGVYVVQEMLRNVPKDVLKRTGIAGLVQQVRSTLPQTDAYSCPMLVSKDLPISSSKPGNSRTNKKCN